MLIIALIIVIIVLSSSSDEEENQEKIKDYGTINCYYKIESESQEIQIISENYNELPNFDIYVEGKKIEYTKKYKFEKAKTYNIQYKLKGDLNMDYMFKDIFSLTNIDINSDKENSPKIKSMKGTFENCINLIDFKNLIFSCIRRVLIEHVKNKSIRLFHN